MLPKGMETFMFHLFSKTIKCFISALEHAAKIAKKSRICQTVTGHVLFCLCSNWANSHHDQSKFLPPTPNFKIP